MAGGNTSSAVRQQRREAKDSLDDFPTPPWVTRALCEWLLKRGFNLRSLNCREPAANRGHMVRPLGEYFRHVDASDVYDYKVGFPVVDYLFGPLAGTVDFTITNPPFRLAEQFIQRAMLSSRLGFAVLVRSAFTEGEERYEKLYRHCRPSFILQPVERVVMLKGRLIRAGAPDPANIDAATGEPRKASTATASCWHVWLREAPQGVTIFDWIPKCRRELERPGDYPAEQVAA